MLDLGWAVHHSQRLEYGNVLVVLERETPTCGLPLHDGAPCCRHRGHVGPCMRMTVYP